VQPTPAAYPGFTKAAPVKALYRSLTHEPDMAGLHLVYHIKNTAPACCYFTGLRGAVFRRSAIYRIYQFKITVQLYAIGVKVLH
jgi:hypothetical protein